MPTIVYELATASFDFLFLTVDFHFSVRITSVQTNNFIFYFCSAAVFMVVRAFVCFLPGVKG